MPAACECSPEAAGSEWCACSAACATSADASWCPSAMHIPALTAATPCAGTASAIARVNSSRANFLIMDQYYRRRRLRRAGFAEVPVSQRFAGNAATGGLATLPARSSGPPRPRRHRPGGSPGRRGTSPRSACGNAPSRGPAASRAPGRAKARRDTPALRGDLPALPDRAVKERFAPPPIPRAPATAARGRNRRARRAAPVAQIPSSRSGSATAAHGSGRSIARPRRSRSRSRTIRGGIQPISADASPITTASPVKGSPPRLQARVRFSSGESTTRHGGPCQVDPDQATRHTGHYGVSG